MGAVYAIWSREGSGRRSSDRERSVYQSLVDHNDTLEVSPRRGHVTSAQLWSSCWRCLNPLCLLALRFASFVILTCFLAWDLYQYGPYIYIYYTEWTFTLVIVYFAIGTVISAYGCIVYYSKELPISNGKSAEFGKIDEEESVSSSTVNVMSYCKGDKQDIKLQSHYDQEYIQQRAGFWGYLMQTAYQTCAGAVIMTDLVFWCLIVPFLSIDHFQLDVLMGCMHTLNLVFLLLDAAVNSLPFPWFRLAYFVLWSCCYVVYQWVLHACGYST